MPKYCSDLSPCLSVFLPQICPILFNIYRIKSNEGHFSSGTVIICFWDKPYQEINFKSNWNTVILFKYEKILWDLRMSRLIFFSFYLFLLTFAMKLKDVNHKNYWNILAFCDQRKVMSDLIMSHGKMSYFVSFPLFGFTLVIKLRHFNSESHWNSIFSVMNIFW